MKIQRKESDWKKILTPQQFQILREKGTEPPFSGEFVDNHENGIYSCVACGNQLFDSSTKFESGSGWPSFYNIVKKGNVILQNDDLGGLNRIEVLCAKCGGHLGHLFDDGPREKTGLRYCINSCALKFDSEG